MSELDSTNARKDAQTNAQSNAKRRVLVRDGFIDDAWALVDDTAPIAADALVTVPRLLAGAVGARGVRVSPKDDVRALAGKLEGIALVELVLVKFNEGRPYTQARLLREELGYRGDIRAIGEVHRDLLWFLFRCGVTQAVLKRRDEEAHAHAALTSFSVQYQGAADIEAPLWRRSRRGAGTVVDATTKARTS